MRTDSSSHKPVLVGVDGSEPALRAARWAAAEAERRGARLWVVNASGSMDSGPARDRCPGPNRSDVPGRRAREHVEHAAASAAHVAAGVEVAAVVLPGYPVTRLVAESRNAQLLVMGGRGTGGLPGSSVGSVAFALAAHATCPVVVVRGAGASEGPVVVGVDGSAMSEIALGFAFEAADAAGAPLVALHSWWDAPAASATPMVEGMAVEATGPGLLADRMTGWAEKFPDVPVQQVVTADRTASALVERSGAARLVVVGARGDGRFGGLVLGSVTHALLHHARCPVAVVRPDTTCWPPAAVPVDIHGG